VAIRGIQWPSVAIRGTQWPSVAIGRTQYQWYSEVSQAIDETHLRDEYGFQSRMQLRERRLGQAQAAELLVDLRRRVGRRVARALDEGSIAPQGIACIEHERVEARDVLWCSIHAHTREAIRRTPWQSDPSQQQFTQSFTIIHRSFTPVDHSPPLGRSEAAERRRRWP